MRVQKRKDESANVWIGWFEWNDSCFPMCTICVHQGFCTAPAKDVALPSTREKLQPPALWKLQNTVLRF